MKSMFSEEFERINALLADADSNEFRDIISRELSTLSTAVRALQQQLTLLRVFSELYPLVKTVDQRTRSQMQLPATFGVEASELLLPGDGFYDLEYTDRGQPYRWTGPQNTFAFNVWIDRRRPLKVDLHTVGHGARENAAGLAVYVDGAKFQAAPSDGGFAVRGIPPRTEPGPTTVLFEVPRMTLPPAEAEDPRALGIPFHRLDVTPDV